MRHTFILLSFALTLNVFAKDMSRTESYKDAYKDLPDGSTEYIGRCSTHQDYENKHFKVTETIIEYFEPEYDMTEAEFEKKTARMDKELKKTLVAKLQFDSLKDVDDLTLEKIVSLSFKGLDLYRLNIGVGGGNGMFLVFNKTKKNGNVQYELLSDVFDGDIEFCDSKVWLKK